ncbi:MAG: chromosomal replication initiator protein DnaA [Clostridia bacterium]|nr:chromosomal replication initiator protein DnaA [Clostridia bacterium]MBR6679689.1 chromosomal replication initiator protein DnaA [Clostridia bacterium]
MSYIDELENVWTLVKESLYDKYTKNFVELWFSRLKILSYEDEKIKFSTDSQFTFNLINDKYIPAIKEGFVNIMGFEPEIELIFVGTPTDTKKIIEQIRGTSRAQGDEKSEESEKEFITAEESERRYDEGYNHEYTFDNFIVGSSNKYAHAACTAVARTPAKDYNPLFIYGPSGLGKTHLMSAVVNEIKRKKPDTKVVYIKGEDLTNQLVESLSRHDMQNFRNKFRNCDILLIDDIQFIAGKTSTQEEFFHTFDALYEDHKQIILTSDKPPKDIQPLEERLRTRFEWGLIADIQPPDLELRIAIFKKKAEQASIVIPDDVLTFLAENLRSNIRQIEGAIKKLSAKSFVMGQEITMELARSCINELLGGAEPISVTVDKIFAAIFKKYNVTKEDVLGKKRNREIANARHMAIYLIKEITEMSYPDIGKIFSRDHTTAIASYQTVEKRLSSDALAQVEIDELKKEVAN